MSFGRRSAPRARIACLTSGEAAQAALTTCFAKAGFKVTPQGEAEMSDIGLVDLRGRDITAKQARGIAAALRKRSPECAVLFLIDPHLMPKGRAILKRVGECLPAEENLEPAIARCRQIIRLRNLAEETGERLKSLAGISRLADFPMIETAATPPRILVAGEPGPYALAAAAAADAASGQWTGVISAGQSLRAIETGGFDCAVFLPNEKNDLLASLARSLQRNPKHSDLPIIHIATECCDFDRLAQKGARDFLLAAHMEHDLPQKIMTATRRARLAAAMRKFLNACAGEGVRDPASGAFTASFFAQHGSRLCGRADHARRPLSLAVFKLSPQSLRQPQSALDKRVLHQAARLISRVTRAEDFVARLSPDCFVLAMPATVRGDAEAVASRIEGVLANTLFRGLNSALFSVGVIYTVTMRERGLCIEETVAAALADLRRSEADKVSG